MCSSHACHSLPKTKKLTFLEGKINKNMSSFGTSSGGRIRRGTTTPGGRGQFNLSGMADQPQTLFSPTVQQPHDFSLSRGRGYRYLQNPLESQSHPCKVEATTPEVDQPPTVTETKKETSSTGVTATQPTAAASVSAANDGKGPCVSCQQGGQLMASLVKDLGTTLVNFAAKWEQRPPPK